MNNNKEKYNKIVYLTLIFLALNSVCGAIIYKIYALNNIGVLVSIFLSSALLIIIHHFFYKNKDNLIMPRPTITKEITKIDITLGIFYFIFFVVGFYIIINNRTSEAIISPWEVVPWEFFLVYGLMTIILILNILNNSKLTTALISFHYFFSFSITTIIYKIGYGFDPFIHEATMNLIDKIGSVDPKPFYYLSEYSFIIILHKITFIPITWLNKFLVPFLASILLPFTIKKVFTKWLDDTKIISLTSLIILIIPFSFFILTVPQSFAYLLLISVILLGLTCDNILDLIVIYLLSFTAILAQPIAGIPSLFFALILTIYHSNNNQLKKYFYLLIATASTVSLPLLFYFLTKNSTINLANNQNKIFSLSNIIIPNQENVILNFIYLYGFNIKLIVALILLAGIIITYKYKKVFGLFFLYLIMSISLLLSYFITKKINFDFLINYERDDYANRILLVSAFFLLPFLITALYTLIYKVLQQNNAIKIPIIIFLTLSITTSLYVSYPRFDRYFNSRGYSTSQNDVDTVRWIEENSKEDYVVLANQQVSVAALHEFGFKKYYKNDIFYYPIPTGGQLYQLYLDMVYKKPTRETMLNAMDLTGVNEAYFVLNKYWWASPKILEEAKLEANLWQKIDQGEVYIFKYSR